MPTTKKSRPSKRDSPKRPHDRLFGPVPGAKPLYDAMLKFVTKARLRRESSGEIRAAVRNMADLALAEIDQRVDF